MQQSLELPQSVIDFTKLTASAPVQLDDIVLPVGVNENDDGTEASSSQEAASSNYDLWIWSQVSAFFIFIRVMLFTFEAVELISI